MADGYRFLLTSVKSVLAGVLEKGSVWPIGAGNHARPLVKSFVIENARSVIENVIEIVIENTPARTPEEA